MNIPKHYLLSNLLQRNVRCNQGLDHGNGVIAWMYPPVHRVLGWASRPSRLSLKRHVWQLNQLKALTNTEAYVRGNPSDSDQATLDRFPTLLDADLISQYGEKIATIADLIFDTKNGQILYYLVSRSNPKIPGTSRWKFDLNQIIDQEPGFVSSNINSIDDLPLIKSSIKQDLINKTQELKTNFNEISTIANGRLEGWLDDNPMQNFKDNLFDSNFNDNSEFNEDEIYSSDEYTNIRNEEDPWI
ncbi:PRC-barrel domain-containing protein [Prochlorococcus marinus]|uniref:PRC-barrel domain-containing protein n=1 Tax=Prochlorococcus marinus TaxID=1219 RepID=UPI0022B5358A|nr:PRC-barrel domain-containing protein [Prochlorococcus marinus]